MAVPESQPASQIDVDLDLSELIELMERIDWTSIPEISTGEAAAWTARLVEARDNARAAVEGDSR